MHNQENQPNLNQSTSMPSEISHGGHELFDAQEVLSSVIGVLDQYTMFRPQIKCQELQGILEGQYSFIQDEYNVTLETFKTGAKPSHSITSYNMEQNNNVIYGLTKMPPEKPIQSVNEVSDQGISGYMLGLVKSVASLKAMTALEMTNPVLRRVVADSVPNWIEMSYELFLYRNKNHYYQVPQLKPEDMQQILNSFAPSSNMMQ